VGTALAAALFLVWPHRPGIIWPAAAGLVTLAAAASTFRSRRGLALLLGLVGAAGGAALGRTSDRLARVERSWETDSTGVRWRLVEAAGRRLNADLADAVMLVGRLAGEAADLADRDRATAFDRLAAAMERDGPERGVVVFDPDGRPWAWAGRHRMESPLVSGLDARITPFYAVLSAGRQGTRGGFATAHVVWRCRIGTLRWPPASAGSPTSDWSSTPRDADLSGPMCSTTASRPAAPRAWRPTRCSACVSIRPARGRTGSICCGPGHAGPRRPRFSCF
jgi:hypothetical protein